MGKLIATIVLIVLRLSVFAHGDLHKQIDDLTAQIKQQPESASLCLRRGRLHLQHRSWREALADAQDAFKKGAKTDAQVLEAEIHLAAKNPDQAEGAAARVLADAPQDPRALVLRARARRDLKKFSPAAADYEKVLALAPASDPDIYLEAAESSENSSDLNKALQIIDAGIKARGSLPAFQQRAVLLEAKAGRFDAALARISRYRQTDRRHHFWSELQGDVHAMAGQPDLARAAYQNALDGRRTKSPQLAQKLSVLKTPPSTK
jgi:tetratricopeptide (TPR) repeat protein